MFFWMQEFKVPHRREVISAPLGGVIVSVVILGGARSAGRMNPLLFLG